MANVNHQSSLPDSSNKTDFYNLVDNSTVTGIVDADISASAAIAATKLATIATAGKVDGTSLTGLSNVPSGAGVLPAVNLPNSIADSHLATIATAGKVSGAALTSLTLIPSGAGIIPTANLPTLGALTLISNTAVATAATTGNISIINSNYYVLNITFNSLSGDDTFIIRINADSGSHYNYVFRGFVMDGTPTASNGVGSAAASISTTILASTNAGSSVNMQLRLFPQNSTNAYILEGYYQNFAVSGSGHLGYFTGLWNNSAAATSISILTSGGATFSGNAYLYKYSLV